MGQDCGAFFGKDKEQAFGVAATLGRLGIRNGGESLRDSIELRLDASPYRQCPLDLVWRAGHIARSHPRKLDPVCSGQ